MKSPYIIKKHITTEYVGVFKVLRCTKKFVEVEDSSGRRHELSVGDTLTFRVPGSYESVQEDPVS